ncbi:MAG TPA: hypothetical protein P5277_02270 [Candidatus Paceibacterota bacterium]|nr:hypothetical protein [Candidatus Paceibacterota bacterium]
MTSKDIYTKNKQIKEAEEVKDFNPYSAAKIYEEIGYYEKAIDLYKNKIEEVNFFRHDCIAIIKRIDEMLEELENQKYKDNESIEILTFSKEVYNNDLIKYEHQLLDINNSIESCSKRLNRDLK